MSEDNKAKNSEEIIFNSLQNPWKVFVIEAFLFSLTLGLGIAAAFRLTQILELQKIPLPQLPPEKFIIYFLLTTLFILFISYFLKFSKGKGIIFKALFILAVFLGGSLFLNVWIPDIFALALMAALVLWWVKSPSVLIQDFCVILAMAGVGSALGITLQPLIIIPLLVIFSVYDFIAVYKTKHMIRMAKEMIESRAILALVIPPNLKDFQGNLGEIRPGGKFLILGGGDVVFPLLFCASLIPSGITSSLIVALFSLLGLSVSFYLFSSQKIRQPIPALPPIALFSIIGFLITQLI